MKAKERLAAALRERGMDAMADKAATGYYSDFESPLAFPITQLVKDLRDIREYGLAERAINGDFDGE